MLVRPNPDSELLLVSPGRKASVCRNNLKRRKGISQPRASARFYEEYGARKLATPVQTDERVLVTR